MEQNNLTPEEDDFIIDSVRPFLLAKDLKCKTIGDYLTYMRMSGHSVTHWPEFTRTSDPREHLTKAGQAMIIISEIDHARQTVKQKRLVAQPLKLE